MNDVRVNAEIAQLRGELEDALNDVERLNQTVRKHRLMVEALLGLLEGANSRKPGDFEPVRTFVKGLL